MSTPSWEVTLPFSFLPNTCNRAEFAPLEADYFLTELYPTFKVIFAGYHKNYFFIIKVV